MKNKLQVGDKVRLIGNPLDEQLGQFLSTEREYAVTETSNTVSCGSGLAVKIDSHDGWLDSAWCVLVKKHNNCYK